MQAYLQNSDFVGPENLCLNISVLPALYASHGTSLLSLVDSQTLLILLCPWPLTWQSLVCYCLAAPYWTEMAVPGAHATLATTEP